MTTGASPDGSASPGEALLALAVLSERPDPAHGRVSAALGLGPPPPVSEYTEVLGLLVVPYAAVYLGPEGMLGGEAAARVAGFWRAVGRVPPAEPDHLAALLGLYAALARSEAEQEDPSRAALRRRARGALLFEHLLGWVPVFARAVTGSGSAYYAEWAALLLEALAAEAALVDLPDVDPPDGLPSHLREAPGLSLDGPGVRDLAQQLLTPVRSGVVLTRRDLARAARHQDLGMRVGERSFVLASLLEQDGPSTLEWVAAEADAWAAWHRHDGSQPGPVARFWASRAEATAAACRARAAGSG